MQVKISHPALGWRRGGAWSASVRPRPMSTRPAIRIPRKLEQVGTVEGSVSSVGLMVGVRWGEGTLTFGDVTRRFDIIGAKALETGVAANDFTGQVYNMTSIDDFTGTYYGAGAKVTVIAGEGEGVFNNAQLRRHQGPDLRRRPAALGSRSRRRRDRLG